MSTFSCFCQWTWVNWSIFQDLCRHPRGMPRWDLEGGFLPTPWAGEENHGVDDFFRVKNHGSAERLGHCENSLYIDLYCFNVDQFLYIKNYKNSYSNFWEVCWYCSPGVEDASRPPRGVRLVTTKQWGCFFFFKQILTITLKMMAVY